MTGIEEHVKHFGRGAFRRFDPLERDISRLILGTLFLAIDTLDETSAVLEEWVESGGNAFDTAHDYGFAERYGWGDCERTLGVWLERHAVRREELVVVSKGGHPNSHRSRVTPEDITSDLRDSLVRLGGPVEIYLLHRDDPTVEVGPLIEVLNEHQEAGRIGAFGASNWSPARMAAANEYAAARGLHGFVGSSLHLSLAEQNEPHWPGALSAREPATIAWHRNTGVPLFAWSALARGFFTDRFSPGAITDTAVERVYDSAANWQRRRRAEELARLKHATANQVALAWVLNQNLPVYAVIGPRTVDELRECIAAVDIVLDERELAWLNLETDDLD